MRYLTWFVVSAVASAGCIGPSRAPGRTVGALVAGTGFLLIARGSSTSCTQESFEESLGCAIDTSVGIGAGALLLATGLAVLIYNEARKTERDPDAPEAHAAAALEHHYVEGASEIREPATADPLLRQLTLQASVAARAGHCSAVSSLAARVATRDRSFRHGGFVVDTAIVRCLDR